MLLLLLIIMMMMIVIISIIMIIIIVRLISSISNPVYVHMLRGQGGQERQRLRRQQCQDHAQVPLRGGAGHAGSPAGEM